MIRASDPQYWRIRSAEAQQVYDQFVDDAEDDMLRILKSVQRDAELAVRRHEEKWSLDHAENQKVLSASELVEYRRNFVEMSRGVTGYTTELNALSTQIQMSRQSALAQQMGLFAAQISEGNLRVATATMNKMGEFAQSYSQFSVETGFKMGVNWDSASPNQLMAMMQTQRQENFYSDKIWSNRDKLVKTLNEEITRGMIQGTSAKEMAERIASAMNTSVSNAMRVVRTETTAIASIAEMNTYAQAGVKEYEYLATLDNRTTKICQDMDGHIIPLKDAELGTTAPPLHPNCRSTTIPHIPDDEFSIPAERAARDAEGDTVYVPEDMKYDDWKKAKEDGSLGTRDGDAGVAKSPWEAAAPFVQTPAQAPVPAPSPVDPVKDAVKRWVNDTYTPTIPVSPVIQPEKIDVASLDSTIAGDDERILLNYMSNNRAINSGFRSGDLSGHLGEMVGEIDELMKKNSTDEVTSLWRVVRETDGYDPSSWKIGDSIPEPGYLATSASESLIRDWQMDYDKTKMWVIEVDTPAGQNFIPNNRENLEEVILPHGSVMNVTDIDRSSHTIRTSIRYPTGQETVITPLQPDFSTEYADPTSLKGTPEWMFSKLRDDQLNASSDLGYIPFASHMDGWAAYTGEFSRQIQRYLRDPSYRDEGERYLTHIENFDAMIQKYGRVTTTEGSVWRGVVSTPEFDPALWRVGDVVPELGYLSTTTNYEIVGNFLDAFDDSGMPITGGVRTPTTGWIYEIRVPKGTRFIAGTDYEDEMIFPHGSELQVLKIDRTNHRVLMGYLEPEPVADNPSQRLKWSPTDSDDVKIEKLKAAMSEVTREVTGMQISTFYNQETHIVESYFRDPDTHETVFKMARSLDGDTVAHELFEIAKQYQGLGWATEINRRMFEIYRASGMKYVTVEANIDVGGYTWARQGFDWDPFAMSEWDFKFILDSYKNDLRHIINTELFEDLRPDALRRLNSLIPDQDYDPDGLEAGPLAMMEIPEGSPTPYEISQFMKDLLTWEEDGRIMWPGKKAMLGSQWLGRFTL